MADDTLKKILFGFILTSLFSILLFTVITDEGRLYEKDTSEITGSLSFSEFNQSVNTIQDDSENLRERFEKQSIWSTVAGVVVTGIFDIGKSMIAMVFAPFIVIANVMENIFHIPKIVMNVVMGLLTLSLLFGLWALIKIGK